MDHGKIQTEDQRNAGSGAFPSAFSGTPDVSLLKKELRRRFLKRRAGLDPAERNRADKAIFRFITEEPVFRKARIVAGYATDGTEPDVLPVLAQALRNGAFAALPKWDGTKYILSRIQDCDLKNLVPGKWSLPEPVSTDPVSLEEEILFLVPGAAFDDAFMRLGRGGGIYDRFLHAGRHSYALGVFYECQHSLTLPSEEHDASLDMIVTETGVREKKRRSL